MTTTKEKIVEFLNQHQLMSLATVGQHPWIANVYFGFDLNLNFYFVSPLDSLHCQPIKANSQVACGIYDSNQTPIKQKTFTKLGVQFWGESHLLTQDNDIQTGLNIWKKHLGIQSNKTITLEAIKTNQIESEIFIIKPKLIQLFIQEPEQDEVLLHLQL